MLRHQAYHRMLGDVLDINKTNLKLPPIPTNVAATQQTAITTQNEKNTPHGWMHLQKVNKEQKQRAL